MHRNDCLGCNADKSLVFLRVCPLTVPTTVIECRVYVYIYIYIYRLIGLWKVGPATQTHTHISRGDYTRRNWGAIRSR